MDVEAQDDGIMAKIVVGTYDRCYSLVRIDTIHLISGPRGREGCASRQDDRNAGRRGR